MEKMLSNPEMKQQYLELQKQFESELERLTNAQQKRDGNATFSTNATIRIPVAIHYPNVVNTSAESVKSCLRLLAQKQVAILNADYNATNSDLSLWTAASTYYPGVNIGDMDVSWEIATQNHPSSAGLTNGTLAVTFGTHFLTGDIDPEWAGYCNLVVKSLSGGILGYSPLAGSPSQGMTVVMDNNAFGATMTGSPATCTGYVPGAPYNLGRTVTHEVGHYLGLRHIWGDGACVTDYCDDTPSAAAQNVGAPSYPLNVGSCSSPTNATEGEMFMNFMDYPWDPYKYMFTTDQATRMQTAMLNSPNRNQLGTHGLCSAPIGLTEVNFKNNFSIYPNPAKTELNLNVSQNDINELSISNLLGQVLMNVKNKNSIDISNLTKGIYLVTITQGQNIYTKKFIKE
jgi:hypothetical protein